MLKGIDHSVVVVPELEAAIRNYEDLGFTVRRGGKHNVGTLNALIAFADGSLHGADRFPRTGGRAPMVPDH